MVEAPELFRVLYLSNRMNVGYRYLKRVLAADDRFEFNSIVRVGEDKFLPFGKDIPPNWPEKPDYFNEFDVLFIDSLVLSEWEEPLVDGVRNFVSKREVDSWSLVQRIRHGRNLVRYFLSWSQRKAL